MRWLSLLLVGCASAAPSPQPLTEPPRLVAVSAPTIGPEGSDAPPRVSVAFAFADGTRRPVDREAIAFVPRWRQGAALVDPEGRLYEVTPDGRRRMLARSAVGVLAADAERLAYVTERGGLASLHLHDGRAPRTLAEGLASIGTIRLEPDAAFFVGARPGGIIGVWVVDREARCLTNCALRTGEPFLERFVPPPVDPDAFEIGARRVAWTTPEGLRHEVPR